MPLTSSTSSHNQEVTRSNEVRKQPFTLFESAPSRRRPFTAGFLVHVVFIFLLIRIGAYTPKIVLTQPKETVELIAPRLEEPPAPKPKPVIAPRLPHEVPPPPKPLPEIEPPKVEAKLEPIKPLPPTPAPVPKVAMNNFAAATPRPEPPAPPKPAVKTDVFAGSSAAPTIKAPPEKVQTGGFGDVNGFKGQTTQEAKLNAPKLGAFDRPSGPGNGNGWAGAHGKPGVVASSGFGSGVAVVPASHETPGGGVHAGGFGDATVAQAGGPMQPKKESGALVPVEIVEKPQPQYTKEARDLKIEGEVHLKVLFQANGSVQVLQVVRGLGHGLDEAAEAAAQKIRFKPAQRDGRPCDMTATVHIVFQLAS